jgi:hypothetical protein
MASQSRFTYMRDKEEGEQHPNLYQYYVCDVDGQRLHSTPFCKIPLI